MSNVLAFDMEMKPNNLCFDKQLFHKENFSVDEFLTEHRRIANLESLRDDLGIFLKNLRSSTIELINKDYAEFVELAATLSTLNEKVFAVDEPLRKISVEVLDAKNLLEEKINRVDGLLQQRLQARKKMQSIQSTIKVQTCLEKLKNAVKNTHSGSLNHPAKQLKLGRALSEINQFYYHSKHIQDLNQAHVEEFEQLFCLFLSHLEDSFLHAIRTERNFLVDCLRLYVSVDKISLAHDIVRQKIVMPILVHFVSEDALHNEPSGLEGLYSKIISNIDRELKYLLDLTQTSSRNDHVEGFDFMIHSVWPELETRLEFNLKSIFSPGNPDTFFKCYNQTLVFLDHFEERCRSVQSVNTLRRLKSYQNFLHCWNLPVYYTLRFQELGGRLEGIMHTRHFALREEPDQWKLVVSHEVWSCLMRCWGDDIFIRQLAHRFWKFNLQVIARYRVWIRSTLETKISSQLPIPKLTFLTLMYTDGCHLIENFPIIFQTAKSRIGGRISETVLQNMLKCLNESEEKLQEVSKEIKLKVIDIIADKNLPVVRQVTDIPRLYRRTNRDVPTQPCSYVTSLLTPVDELTKIRSPYISNWIPSILSSITSMYHEQVSEVLTSVQRTEESLRKFKKIRDPSNLDLKNNTDDDKIRLQLRIDIQNYVDKVKSLTDTSHINKLSELDDILLSLKTN